MVLPRLLGNVVFPRVLGNVVLPSFLGNVILPRVLGNVVLPCKGFGERGSPECFGERGCPEDFRGTWFSRRFWGTRFSQGFWGTCMVLPRVFSRCFGESGSPKGFGERGSPKGFGGRGSPEDFGECGSPEGFWGAWLLGPKVYRNLRFSITRRKTILKALDEIYILAVSKRDLESSAWDICSINYMRHWIRGYPFSWTVAHRGRQSWQAYKIIQTTKHKYKY